MSRTAFPMRRRNRDLFVALGDPLGDRPIGRQRVRPGWSSRTTPFEGWWSSPLEPTGRAILVLMYGEQRLESRWIRPGEAFGPQTRR